jgi:nitrous oxidase accessory protein
VHLSAGVHRGPIVIRRTETLVGDPGAVVVGGIVVRADDVTVRDVTVVGGADGITVDGATNVVLDGVRVRGSHLDGIHVRRSQVMIRDCSVSGLRSRFAQAIDISFALTLPMSLVEGCSVRGGQEGIVSHFANVEVRENHVSRTTLRGITVTEMSMGTVEENRVDDALGVGIFCADYSECEIERNAITDTRPDRASGDLARLGFGVVAHSHATATLGGNVLRRTPGGVAAFVDGHLER